MVTDHGRRGDELTAVANTLQVVLCCDYSHVGVVKLSYFVELDLYGKAT